MSLSAVERLCKWRMVLAGWHHGTRSMEQPGTKAMRDMMDKWLIMRIEGNALAGLLIAKGVMTATEYGAALEHEAKILDGSLQKQFPGFRTTETGVQITDVALANETMQRLGFPP